MDVGRDAPLPRNSSRSELRVAVALADRWEGALVCAELRERGCNAEYFRALAVPLLVPDGPVDVVLVDRESLRERDASILEWSRRVSQWPATVLLTSAGGGIPRGTWDRVLRRPATIGFVVECLVTIETGPRVLPEAPKGSAVELRLGPPWPTALCHVCGHTRHCQEPARPADWRLACQAILQFAVEHGAHSTAPFPAR